MIPNINCAKEKKKEKEKINYKIISKKIWMENSFSEPLFTFWSQIRKNKN